MANTTVNLEIRTQGRAGYKRHLPAGAVHLYKGAMISHLDADGGAVPTSTASSGQCVGVSQHEVDNSGGSTGDKRLEIETDRIFEFNNDTTNPVDETMDLGTTLYAVDDHTVSDTQTASEPVAGILMGVEASGKIAVWVSPRVPA